jgi:hypothetical protein
MREREQFVIHWDEFAPCDLTREIPYRFKKLMSLRKQSVADSLKTPALTAPLDAGLSERDLMNFQR